MENTALISEPKANSSTYIGIVLAMMGAIMFGVDCSNFGLLQGFQAFIEEFCFGTWGTPEECGTGDGGGKGHPRGRFLTIFIMASQVLVVFGAALSAVCLAPTIANNGGRRMCISAGAAITTLGTVISAFLSFQNSVIFLISRFITGFGVGVCCYALPMYNSEVSTPKIRGITGSLFQLFTVIGGVIATFACLGWENWQFGLILPGIFAAIVACTIWLAPESPRWIFKKKGFEAGVAALRKVRQGDVMAEAREIQAAIDADAREAPMARSEACSDSNLRKRSFIACYLQIAQQATGVNAFLGFAGTIFTEIGMTNPVVFNALFNIVMLVGCITGIVFIDSPRGGRRKQLLGATILMGPSLIIAASVLAAGGPGWIVAFMVCFFGFSFQLGWGMMPWIYPSEIFSNREREVAMGFAVGAQYLTNTAIYFVSPLMMNWSSIGTMYIFAAINVSNFFYVSLCIKETKGIPLEKVPELFGKVTKTADAAVA